MSQPTPPVEPTSPSGKSYDDEPKPFFGREAALQEVLDVFRGGCRTKGLSIIGVTGMAGLGKTRFAERALELIAEECETMGPYRVYGVAVEQPKPGRTYQLFPSIIRQRFGISRTAGPDDAREHMIKAVSPILGEARAKDTSLLLSFIMELPLPESIIVDTAEAQKAFEQRAFKTLYNLIKFDSRRTRHVLFVDNVHRLSAVSLGRLGQLLDTLAATPSTLLMSGDDLPDLGRPSHTVTLGTLDDVVIEDIVRAQLRKVEQLPEEIVSKTVVKAKGNPQLAADLVAILINRQIIDTTEEPWVVRLDRFRRTSLPGTLEGSSKERVDTLTSRERGIMEKASLFGMSFWFSGVLSLMLSDVPSDQIIDEKERFEARLNQVLLDLQSKGFVEFVVDSGINGELEFAFTSERDCEVLRLGLYDEDYQRYQRLIGQWFETIDVTSLPRWYQVAAFHFQEGLETVKAARYFRLAGTVLKAAMQLDETVTVLLKALEMTGDAQSEERFEILKGLGESATLAGRLDEAGVYYMDMLKAAIMLRDKVKEAFSYEQLGSHSLLRSDSSRAEQLLGKAAGLYKESGNAMTLARLYERMGSLHIEYHRSGKLKEAMELYREGLAIRERMGDRHGAAYTHLALGLLYLSLCRSDPAEEHLQRARTLFSQIRFEPGLARVGPALGYLWISRGRYDKALQTIITAFERYEGILSRHLRLLFLDPWIKAGILSGDKAALVEPLRIMEGVAEDVTEPGENLMIVLLQGLMAVFDAERSECSRNLKRIRLATPVDSGPYAATKAEAECVQALLMIAVDRQRGVQDALALLESGLEQFRSFRHLLPITVYHALSSALLGGLNMPRLKERVESKIIRIINDV